MSRGVSPVGEVVGGLLDRDALVSPDELAAFLAIPPATLRQWRYQGVGPRSLRVGRHARYEPAEIRRWLADCRPPDRAT